MKNVSHSFIAWRSRYLPLVFALWAGSIVTAYLFRFPLPQPAADNPYPAAMLTLWISGIATANGSALLRLLKLPLRSQAEHLVFSAALGFAALAYLIFGIGLAQALSVPVIYGLLALLTLLPFREYGPLFAALRGYARRAYHITKLDLALGSLLLGLMGYHWLGTLIPPTLFDALVYHLAIPKLYLLHHGISYNPHSFFSNFPFLMEMLYTLGLAVHGPLLVNMLNYAIHLLMLAGLYAVARAYCGHRVALVSVAIFYAVPWVGMESFLPYIDVGLALYAVLAAYALLNWISRQHAGWLVVCGACCGVGLSIKYLGAHNALLMGLSVVGWLLWSKQRAAIKSLLLFAVPAVACGAPWYVKNLIFTGNPIYPFIFGGGEWSAETLQRYMRDYQVQFGNPLEALAAFLKLPWELVFSLNITPSNVPIGPVLLVFVPLLLFVRRVPRVILFFVGSGVALTGFWFLTSPQSRFLIPTLPLFSIAAAYAVERLSTNAATAWVKRSAYAVLLALLLSNIGWELIYVHSFFDPVNVIMGLESKDEYLSRQHPDIYPITRYANATLPPDAVIMFLGDTRGYYADRPFIANTAFDTTPLVELAAKSETVDDLAAGLRAMGVTHIIWNPREAARLHQSYEYLHWKRPEDEQLFREFYRTRLKRLQRINDSELLEIMP